MGVIVIFLYNAPHYSFLFAITQILVLLLGSEESRRKFYSSILVVGGGIKFPGIVEFLEKNLTKLVPSSQRTGRSRSSENSDVFDVL